MPEDTLGYDLTVWSADTAKHMGRLPLFEGSRVKQLLSQEGPHQRLLGRGESFFRTSDSAGDSASDSD